MDIYTSDTTTFRDYLKIIFRHKIVFLILPIAILIPVYVSLELNIPMYKNASVKMYVKGKYEADVDYYKAFGALGRPNETHSSLVKSNIVIERVVKALKLYQLPLDYELGYTPRLKAALMKQGVERLKQNVAKMSSEENQDFLFKRAMGRLSANTSASPSEVFGFFTINVRDVNPEFAAVLANSVSRSYLIFDLEQQILELQLKYGEKHSTVRQLQDHIKKLETTLDGKLIPDLEAIGPASIKVIQQAKGSVQERGVNQIMIILMSFVASMILSIVLCFVFELFDHTIRSQKDLIKFLNVSFLGAIPKRKSGEKLLISDTNPKNTEYMKSFQSLSENLSALMKYKNLKTVLVTDVEQSRETPAVIANLGIHLAHKIGSKVLIVDTDSTNSSMSKTFNIPAKPGLSDILEGKVSLMDTIQDLGSNLHIVPSGETSLHLVMLLGSSIMSDLIKKTSEQFDVVFINSRDVGKYSDAVILSSLTDCTALVINEGRVKRQVLEHVLTPMKQKEIDIIGAILTNRKYVIPGMIYKLT